MNMTPLYLLFYITYTTSTSIVFSIVLAFRLLLRHVSSSRSSHGQGNIVALYEGIVCHNRRHPVLNSFHFPTRYALIDLDRPPYAPPNYLSADDARRAAKTNGTVYLLRIPPSLGYERSPVNIYYCYEKQGSTRTLRRCLVEASNTPWGESVTFVINPTSDIVPKSEYISPFMDMLGNWRVKLNEPGEHLHAIVSVQHPEFGTYFTASYTAKRVEIPSNLEPMDLEAYFWLMPHKVSIMAYWNSLKLWWKNVRFYNHPRRDNPTYREEAFSRDEKIQLCPAFGCNEARIDRSFIWKDAKWPWLY